MLKKKLVAMGVITVMATQIVGCSWFKTDTPVIGRLVGLSSDEAFKVDGNVCTVEEVMLLYMNMQNQYKEDFGGTVDWNMKIENQTFDVYILDKIKSEISTVYAMSALALDRDIVLDANEEQLLTDAADEYIGMLSEAERKYTGADSESVRSLYKNYYLAEKIFEEETSDISTVISDEDARVIRIQCIYIDTKETESSEASEILKQVKKQVENGYQDFLVQANKYSDSVVEMKLKKNEMDEAFEIAAFGLEEGAISEVITQEDGMYLIKCLSTYVEKDTNENKENIVKSTKSQAFSTVYEKYLEEVTTDINSAAWKDIKPSTDVSVSYTGLFDVYEKYMK